MTPQEDTAWDDRPNYMVLYDWLEAGSAIDVSAGFASVSIWTETAASLISPGSKAALYSVKPTIGLVSQNGIVLISSFCDTAEPRATSALDLANLLDVIVRSTKTHTPGRGYASVLSRSWRTWRLAFSIKPTGGPQIHGQSRTRAQKSKLWILWVLLWTCMS